MTPFSEVVVHKYEWEYVVWCFRKNTPSISSVSWEGYFLRSSLWIELSYCFLSQAHLYILSFHLKQQHCLAQLHLIMTNPFTFFQFLLFYTLAKFSFLFKGLLQLKLQTYSMFHIFTYSSQHMLSFQLLYYFSTITCPLCFYHLSLCISSSSLHFWQFCLLLLSPAKIYHTK